MNAVAIVLLIAAVVMIVVGFKGKQDNLITALSGHKYGNTNLS